MARYRWWLRFGPVLLLAGGWVLAGGCDFSGVGDDDSGLLDPDEEDFDGDGFVGSDDCDDNDPEINPDAEERCNRRDDDCDGLVDEGTVGVIYYPDFDRDGFGDRAGGLRGCVRPGGHVENDEDCDDARRDVYPGATEYCDGVDNDCDRSIDEAGVDPLPFWVDRDGDGFGSSEERLEACDAPAGYAGNADDCDDTSAETSPARLEACGDGADNDCVDATADACSYGLFRLDGAAGILTPSAPDQHLGAAVAGVGDVDDDGYDDLLIGAPSTGDQEDGAWWVQGPVSGRRDIGRVGRRLGGYGDGGWAVAGGDLDGDGFGDLVFAEPGHASGDLDDVGRVYVRYGPEPVGCEPYCDGATLTGVESGSRAGSAIGVGDFDGDGRAELVIGAPGRASAGSVYLVDGPPEGKISLADARSRVLGGGALSELGDRVAFADLDGDGRDDVVAFDPAEEGGAVYVWYDLAEGSSEVAAADASLSAPAATPIVSIAAADLDDDGRAELYVGAGPRDTDPMRVAVWVFAEPLLGASGLDRATTTLESGSAWANGAVQVAVGGDVNRDGVGDLLVGVARQDGWIPEDPTRLWEQQGSVYVMAGPIPDGTVSLGTAQARLFGPDSRDLTELAVAFGGDLDRDGYDDVVVGARRNGTTSRNGGVVWIVSGQGL